MAKSNNEDDGGWDEFERWANEPDETDSSNASKPLSASEQAALIEESTPKVRTFWRGSVKMICDAAAECARTAKRLDAEHKKLYVKKLRFGNTVFNMLKRIGEDKRIPKNVKHLSPSISTIYEVSHLSNEQLKLGISEGIVNPGATRDDIKIFRGRHKSPPKLGTQQPGKRPGAAARAPDSGRRSERETSEPQDDEFLEDEEFLEDDQQDDSEPSAESDDVYDSVVAEWKKIGLRRSTWQAMPGNARRKFKEEVLQPEPFKPPGARAK